MHSYRNNSLRARLTSLKVSTALTSNIINDPTVIFSLVHPNISTYANTTSLAGHANISVATAEQILDGYNSGVRAVFILNASLAALCVVVSAVMIKHKELVRADDADLKQAAIQAAAAKSKSGDVRVVPAAGPIELRNLKEEASKLG